MADRLLLKHVHTRLLALATVIRTATNCTGGPRGRRSMYNANRKQASIYSSIYSFPSPFSLARKRTGLARRTYRSALIYPTHRPLAIEQDQPYSLIIAILHSGITTSFASSSSSSLSYCVAFSVFRFAFYSISSTTINSTKLHFAILPSNCTICLFVNTVILTR